MSTGVEGDMASEEKEVGSGAGADGRGCRRGDSETEPNLDDLRTGAANISTTGVRALARLHLSLREVTQCAHLWDRSGPTKGLSL